MTTIRIPSFVLFSVLAWSLTAQAAVSDVEVIDVAEGDVLSVTDADGNRYGLRLAGIDAPESDQPFGERARQALAALVLGKPARLEWDKVDRYGRAVGKLWVVSPDMRCSDELQCPRNLDAGHALITMGLAWHFERYQAEQGEEDRARYADDEREARARKAGLWIDADPVPPWEWRERARQR
jgi:endonuclease YncB( thermonuclease family)